MVRIKTCRLTRNPQLCDSVAWLSPTLAEGHERVNGLTVQQTHPLL